MMVFLLGISISNVNLFLDNVDWYDFVHSVNPHTMIMLTTEMDSKQAMLLCRICSIEAYCKGISTVESSTTVRFRDQFHFYLILRSWWQHFLYNTVNWKVKVWTNSKLYILSLSHCIYTLFIFTVEVRVWSTLWFVNQSHHSWSLLPYHNSDQMSEQQVDL